MSIGFIRGTAPMISVLVFILLFCSCTESSSPGPDWENIGVRQVIVDRIEVAETLAPQDTLIVNLEGSTNPNGRLTLDTIDADRTQTGISLTIWAEVEIWIGTGIMPPFDNTIRCTYKAIPPFDEGMFYIVIEQPDASQLEDSVLIVN
jgi:hypothetical protein